jgi:Cys-tRNA(Pro)/Cys-tRNA(Cys) deacylase
VTADTPAIEELRASGVTFRVVRTERARSAEESAAFQDIEVGQLIRTIVVRRGEADYVFVLVPGGRQIDWPRLRSHLGVNRLSLPDQDEARDVTGYERGAITPFAAATTWPVVADATVADRDVVAIGAGAHGVNVHLAPTDLVRLLDADVAAVTKPAD